MSENLRKLIGVAVMAAIVVVGVVATSGDDSDFARTRNALLVQGVNQGGDNSDIAALEMRIAKIEKLLGQIPELAVLDEVIDRAEAGSALVDRSVAGAIESVENAEEQVGNAEEEALRQIQETIDWLSLDLENEREREYSRSYFEALRNAAATINNQEEEFNSTVVALAADLNAWVENANAQLAGVAPQFGPEFPGIGPMVDILCRTQLAAWGVTADWVEAGWDLSGEFWACGYEGIELEEFRGLQNPNGNIAFCLPGQEFLLRDDRGRIQPQTFVYESIGRVGTDWANTDLGFSFGSQCR